MSTVDNFENGELRKSIRTTLNKSGIDMNHNALLLALQINSNLVYY